MFDEFTDCQNTAFKKCILPLINVFNFLKF